MTRPAGSRPLPLGLTCSFVALVSAGVVGMASQAAFAAGPLTTGTVPTSDNFTGGSGIGNITTTNTATGRWTTIEQTQRAAIASFNKFNIAAGSGVTVSQADSGYRLLARIFDSDPTLIQGALQATGQVYLLNRNGILFDKGAQINVGALFASSLNIKDEDFMAGFDTSATGTAANKFTKFIPFTDPVTGQTLTSGAVQVASGASLSALPGGAIVLIAPQIENAGIITAPDGQVILAAGQTAYLWQRNTENTNDAKASALRGLMVEITAADGDINLTSMVRNLGEISADRGNVSIAALAINQEGRVTAGSSVISNGSIWLTARSVADPGESTTFADNDVSRTTQALGTVTFGKDSYTGTPLLTDEGRLSESASYSSFDVTNADGTTYKRDFRSWIHVVGNKIDNSGEIVSPGGTIDLLALGAGGRVLLESGSTLSAAGNWVDRAMSDNLLTVSRLTSNDLQDAPVQKDGALLGESVTVDVRQGSTLFDVSKYTANLQRSVQEKATVGGAITIEARQGDVISSAGSIVDVSGGGFRYAAGSYTTTKLIGADGKLYDIATASPLRDYIGTTDGISRVYQKAGPTGWSQTRTWATRYKTTPTTESAYVEGASAGSLTVVAPNIVRLGDWNGGVTLGRYQVNQADVSKVAQAATLTIGDASGLTGSSSTLVDRITFGTASDLPAGFDIDDVLPTTLTDSVILPADQFGYAGPQSETYAYSGFGTLNLYSDESITVPAGVEVKLAPGAAFNAATRQDGGGQKIVLEAARDGLDAGAISAPAGSVSLTSTNVILGAGQFAADGSQLAAGAIIDASGVVYAESRDDEGLSAAGGFTARAGDSLTEYLTSNVAALVEDMADGDAKPAGAVAAPRFAINASSTGIKIDGASVEVGDGTTLSAMGGFVVGADNTITGGKGGAITLPYTPSTAGAAPIKANLYGYSLTTGAKLAINAKSSVWVGDYATGSSFLAVDNVTRDLLVAPGFFNKGGFSDYTLSSSGTTLDIAPGTKIAPAAEGIAVELSSFGRRAGATSEGIEQSPASGGDAGIQVRVAGGSGNDAVAADMTIREKVAGERVATDTHFKMVKGASEAQVLSLGEGAEILADPGATVEFNGSSMNEGATLNLLGRVQTAGGSIVVSWGTSNLAAGAAGFDALHPDAETQSGLIHLGANAVLDTSGEFVELGAASSAVGSVIEADGSITRRSRRQGYVTSGGSISLKATNGRIVTEAGSVLDVSGSSAVVDLPTVTTGGPYAAQQIWGDAGSISISSTEAARLAGDLKANAAGNGLGGSFSLAFVRHEALHDDQGVNRTDFAHRIVVSQGMPDSDERIVTGSERYVTSRISADSLNAGGFANVSLKSDNSIEFAGPVQMAAVQGLTLDAPILDVRATTSAPAPTVQLAADHLTLTNTSSGDPWSYRWRSIDRPAGKQVATDPAASVATRAGEGVLVGNARLIDLMGSVTVNGVRGGTDSATGEEARGLVLDASGDIRLTGLAVKLGTDDTQTVDTLAGRLTTAGNIELRAQQVYTTTMSDFTVASQQIVDANSALPGESQTVTNSGTIRISQAAGTPQDVLSAASKLTLTGKQIIQNGTLKAPAGRIELNAPDVSFEPGSLTSISLGGLTVPLGEILNDSQWLYNLGSYSMPLSAAGEMQVVVDGANVDIKSGATIDLSGGGDVQAFEFLAGPGGSKDVLASSSSAPTWAILPSMRLTDAPIDTDLASSAGKSVASQSGYNIIYISGVAGLADGWYPLLDGHYALLPGAYQVSALTAADKSGLVGAAASTYKTQLGSSSYAKQLEALASGAYVGKDLPLGQDVPVGTVGTLLDGTTVVSAIRGVAGTDIHEARTSGYVIRSGDAARRYSEFTLTTSEFFATQATANDLVAPRLPTDAGGLTLKPTGDLNFAGTLLTKPGTGGKAAEIDISADLLAVVTETGTAATEQMLAGELVDLPAGATFVEIDADSLAGIEGSVLLGGSRSADGTLTTGARRVVVATNAEKPLSAAEVMLAAKDQVTVMAGAVVQADLEGTTARNAYVTDGDGALLRASSGGQLTLDRTNTTMTSGNLDIRAGATVTGTSILADATGTNRIDGTLQIGKLQNGTRSGGALGVAAKSVALGETAGFDARGGLVMDNDKLATLNALDELAIRSYSSIDVVGNARVGAAGVLQQLTLDAREIAGYQAAGSATPGQATIAATTLTLRNGSGGSVAATTPNGSGTLDVGADRIVLGKGEKGIRGFDQVNITANTELAQSGKGSLTVAGTTIVTTPRVVASSGSDQALKAASYDGNTHYVLDVTRPATVAAARIAETAASPGGRWSFEGRSVNFDTRIDALSGAVTMAAHGSDTDSGVTIKDGAAVNAGGYSKQFTDAVAYASAGSVELSSDNGNVTVESGAAIDIAAAEGGGDAGKLTATAAKGTVDIVGAVSGGAANGELGSVSVDAATIAHFKELNDSLNAGSVTGERIFRQRTGNVDIGADTSVKAEHVSISADAGDININGKVDASGATGGGRVEMYAQQNLNLAAGSLIDAHGTGTGTQASDAYADGGTVELVATNGSLNFAEGAVVDISAGAKGDAGDVTFAASRSAAGDVLPVVLKGTVRGYAGTDGAGPTIVVRGDRSYQTSAITTAMTEDFSEANAVWWDYAQFIERDATIKDGLLINQSGGLQVEGAGAEVVSVRAGIEIRSPDSASPTDLTLSSAWNLTDINDDFNLNGIVPQWNLHGSAGLLTLRATGTLTIADYVGLPNDYTLPTGESWSIRLVGGADTSAANPLALAPLSSLTNTGDVILADNGQLGADIGWGFQPAIAGRVRTGTGTIEVAAGRNFSMGSSLGANAAIYTVGVSQESSDYLGRYTSGGGDIRIQVQGDATGLAPAGTTQFVNDWYRRTSIYEGSSFYLDDYAAGWFAYRPKFKQGIASFGGGDVTVSVGQSISNVSVYSATSGQANVDSAIGSSIASLLDADGNPMLIVRGGGNLKVQAGANIDGGEYLVSLGTGVLSAGGSIGASTAPALYVMGQGSDAALMGASIRAEAQGDVSIRNVSNPTILVATGTNEQTYGFGDVRTGFFTYDAASAAEVISVTGSVTLGTTTQGAVDGEWFSVAPPSLSLVALSGGVQQLHTASATQPIDLYSSTTGGLTVLAATSISGLDIRALNVSPDALPTWNHAGADAGTRVNYGLAQTNFSDSFAETTSRITSDSSSAADTRFVVEAAEGDIVNTRLLTAGTTSVRAGRDIVSTQLDLQNLSDDDVSRVVAGRDIVQDLLRFTYPTGKMRIAVAGPGTVVVQAGRNVDLGSSDGIIADGSDRNASIASSDSARIIVAAGVKGDLALAAVDALMASAKLFGLLGDGNSAAMAREVGDALTAARADPTQSVALDQLESVLLALSESGRTSEMRQAAGVAQETLAVVRQSVAAGEPLTILQTLLDRLDAVANVDTKDGSAVVGVADAGARAMAGVLLANNQVGPGNVDMYNSKIQTIGGSSIDVLAPGYDSSGAAAGNVNVGMPAGAAKGNTGIQTQTGGGINAYVTGNLNVNSSKILTAQTGDIMLYSTDGSIDAGRGALTSRSSSAPRRVSLLDDDGEFVGFAYLPPVDVTGSGIRTVSSDPDGPGPMATPDPGSVFLFAPKGTINAGEAGIDSAGDVTIRAVQVLNANAISAAGSSSGVPQTSVAAVGTLGAAPTPGSKNDDLLANLPAPSYGTDDSGRPRILMVEVLGVGDGEEVRIERKAVEESKKDEEK